MALVPTRPTRRRSPSPATPNEMDAKTSGITIMNSIRRKICPTGPARYVLIHITVGWEPPSVWLAVIPSTAPINSPRRIFV